MSTEISAGIIIYRKTKDGPRFLLLYHGGQYWNFPKGHLAEGERSFVAALREVYEETGLKKRDLRFTEWFKVQDRFVFIKNKKEISKIVSYYLAETGNPFVRISDEHQGYGWFLYRDAFRMLIYPNLKKNLKRAYDIITRRKGSKSYTRNTQGQSVNVQGNRQETRQS